MRKSLIALVLAVLALSGCSAHGETVAQPSDSTRSAEASPTPTPTVHTMSLDEAAKYYLAGVCAANKATAANSAAFAAQDLAAVKQTAASARDAYQAEAKAFTDTTVVWPSAVSSADIKLITDADFAIISNYDAISTAQSFEAASATSNGYVDNGAAAAAQRIRLALNLSADTSAGC
ncbi:hypothetical protein [Leifsonia sp. AG29]|uniref:hypothetical protein n=1 Tax=Leifsonia sp. AG29 TaxID=2598860 RepID=UPI00131C8A32|nr:hypothetical protein [Leifsonia sp. AG29]